MKTKRYCIFTVVIAAIPLGTIAMADLSFYTDRNVWEAEVNGDIVSESLESLASHVMTEGVNSAGRIDIELEGLSGVNEYNEIIDASGAWKTNDTTYYWGNCPYNHPDAVVNLILPYAVRAFGGDFFSTYNRDGLMLRVNGLAYDFRGLMDSADGDGFVGFIAATPFITITLFDPVKNDFANGIYRQGESFGLDNVSFAVPEPATLSVLGLGILCLRKCRKV